MITVSIKRTEKHEILDMRVLCYLLASSNTSGTSLASFSRATSAIGPKITTGLRNPAVSEQHHVCVTHITSQSVLVDVFNTFGVKPHRFKTLHGQRRKVKLHQCTDITGTRQTIQALLIHKSLPLFCVHVFFSVYKANPS